MQSQPKEDDKKKKIKESARKGKKIKSKKLG